MHLLATLLTNHYFTVLRELFAATLPESSSLGNKTKYFRLRLYDPNCNGLLILLKYTWILEVCLGLFKVCFNIRLKLLKD